MAVLPFANLSGDANQKFFSDGMTQEVTTALANIQDQRVARTKSLLDLSDYLGVGQRSTERAFASLESAGLIRRRTPRLIEILDIDGLRRLQRERRRCHH